MAEIKMPHPAHEEHLCLLKNIGTNLEDVKSFTNAVKEFVASLQLIDQTVVAPLQEHPQTS